MNIKTDFTKLGETERENIEEQWRRKLVKYKSIFSQIQGSFQKKKRAFFSFICLLLDDILHAIQLDYDTDIELLNLKVRRVFEVLMVLHWINRHSPRDVYKQFALEQINFCDNLKQNSTLIPEAIRILDSHRSVAINGAQQLGMLGIEREPLRRINFKDEAYLSQCEGVYNEIYNISSVLLHGGLFAAKFRMERPPDILYQNLLFTRMIELFPLIHAELKQIQQIKKVY